jgi:transcriptional regulator with XRE-family HTH domain
MTLGTKLRNLRTAKGISLEKLALELHISKAAIGKWEADKSKPTVGNLLKLCENFEIDFYDLLNNVSNLPYSKAAIKVHLYTAPEENFTINNLPPPELIESIVDIQKKINILVALQNELVFRLLAKNN